MSAATKGCSFCGGDDHDLGACPWKGKTLTLDLRGFIDALENVRGFHDMSAELIAQSVFEQAIAAQSAPDEREGFEAAIRHSYPRNHYLYLTRKADGYENPYISIRWDGFQAGAAWQRAQSAPVVPVGYVLVPVAATAENGAKAALLGEFTIQHQATCSGCYYDEADEDCEVCGGEVHYTEHVTVPWDTIKEIYAEAVRVLAAPAQPAARHDQGDEVRRLREALERAETYVQTAFSRAQSKDRLGRKLPADHPISVDLAMVQAALSASAEGKA